MSIQVESMPIFCLIWIVIGVIIIVVAIIRLAGHEAAEDYYVKMAQQNEGGHKELEELFNYFLEEEEKKNQDFRELMIGVAQNQKVSDQMTHAKGHEIIEYKRKNDKEALYQEIIRQFEQGQEVEAIAKNLKKGVGEVKLILSLNEMR